MLSNVDTRPRKAHDAIGISKQNAQTLPPPTFAKYGPPPPCTAYTYVPSSHYVSGGSLLIPSQGLRSSDVEGPAAAPPPALAESYALLILHDRVLFIKT